MIPSRRLFYAVGVGFLIALIYSLAPVLSTLSDNFDIEIYQQLLFNIWIGYFLLLVCIALYDFFSGFKAIKIRIRRELPNNLAIGNWTKVKLLVNHRIESATKIQIFDHHPQLCKSQQLPLEINLIPGKASQSSYSLYPVQRGDLNFGRIQYRFLSNWGFWHFNRYSGKPKTVKIYPDFAEIKKYILLGLDDRTSQLGIKLQQRRGQGLEFHRLRKYQREDTIRQIDWKATAKKRELISREYQDERDQQVFFMLDCGRRMRSKDANLSHFDHALNSMLLLSYVALHQGDAVGLMSFSGAQNVWMNPIKGSARINTILNSVYNLQPCSKDSDYITAAETFTRRNKKRSLVVLISNSRDDNLDELSTVLTLLKKRHLVLFANLKEQVLENIVKTPVNNFKQALSYASTAQYLQKRSEKMRGLTHRNVISLDVTADQLPIAIINAYHKMKRRGQL